MTGFVFYDSHGREIPSKPFFNSLQEYEAFRERFSREMKPFLDEQVRVRAESIREVLGL